MPSLRALIPWAALAAALALLILAGRMVLDLRQRLQASEQRAATARAELATATAQAGEALAALATSTALPVARLAEARAALDQILAQTLEALKEPTSSRVDALSEIYTTQALSEVLPELDHLRSQGLHLGGRSGYELEVLEAEVVGTDRARIRTRERWTYDELNEQGQTVRCVRDQYELVYFLQRQDQRWRVQELRLERPAERQSCD